MRPPGPAAKETSQLGENDTLERLIAGLAAAAGEDDFVGLATKQVSHLLAGLVNRLVSGSAVYMAAGRVSEVLAKIGQHGIKDRRIDWGGGVVVEINRRHQLYLRPERWELFQRRATACPFHEHELQINLQKKGTAARELVLAWLCLVSGLIL